MTAAMASKAKSSSGDCFDHNVVEAMLRDSFEINIFSRL
jgi:hypothetical protein